MSRKKQACLVSRLLVEWLLGESGSEWTLGSYIKSSPPTNSFILHPGKRPRGSSSLLLLCTVAFQQDDDLRNNDGPFFPAPPTNRNSPLAKMNIYSAASDALEERTKLFCSFFVVFFFFVNLSN